jgi:LemA protein
MRVFFVLMMALLLSGCGYNDIQRKDEAVKASWAQVLNVYKRRADLIPALVATVKGYAQQEEKILIGVTEARSKVGQVQVNPDDAASLQQFQKAQGELSSALSRLLVITENYPNLKSDQAFLNLQTQLEGTENRITVERERYIQAVRDYNVRVREFPVNLTAMVFGYKQKPGFTVENEREIQEAPVVDFGGQAAPAPVMAPGQTQTIAPVAPPRGLAPTPSIAPVPQPVPAPDSQNMKQGPQPAPSPSGG